MEAFVPWIIKQIRDMSSLGTTLPEGTQGEMLPPEPSPERHVPFFPQERYIKNKWAPETSLSESSLAAIAKAQKLAEQSGTLSPELASYMLPIAMVEGWGTGMGVRRDEDNALYASQRVRQSLKNMGLEEGKHFTKAMIKNQPHIMFTDIAQEERPKLAAIYLAEKAAMLGKKVPVEDIIKRYNGIGSAIEEMPDGPVPADVKVYWKKIDEARRLLAHPANRDFKAFFDREYKR